jgi:hypothetical protein
MSRISDEERFSLAIKAELSAVPATDGWPELAARLTAGQSRRKPTWLRQGRPRSWRLMAAIVAGVLIALIGTVSTFAVTSGVLGDWMRSVGLRGAGAPTPVSVSATRAGITIGATEAYRDSYVVALGLRLDDPAAKRPAQDWISSATMATAGGAPLQLVELHPQGAGGRPWLVVFADPAGGQIKGDHVTLTVTQIARYTDPYHSKAKVDVSGPWTLRLDLHASTSSVRHLAAPAGGQVGQVKVTFASADVSGSYLGLRLDIAELAAGAFTGREPVPGQVPQPMGTDFQVFGPGGKMLEPVATLGNLGKGEDVSHPAPPSTYHQTYLFATAGSGAYKLVVHSGGQTMERTIQVP